MSQANFFKVFIGLETPNIASLKECGKFQNTINLTGAIKIIQQAGLQVMGGFIVGFDNDPEDIFDIQIKFIQETGVVVAMVGTLIALPQTRLWKRLIKEGRILGETSGENIDTQINFIPKMDKTVLVTGYKKILSEIYSPSLYYKRIETFLKNYQSTVRSKVSIKDTIEGTKTLFNSMIEIGIKSEARWHYWKLLAKTLLTKPKAFSAAVELTIMGVHFQKITKKIIG